MGDVAARIEAVRQRIAAAEVRSGRPAGSVTLVGVSKRIDPSLIAEAVEAGLQDLGENYVQEALPKLAMTPPPVRWHFIGRLQTNKARSVAGRFALVQSVDSERLAAELARRAQNAGTTQPILLEVNLDPTGAKSGAAPAHVPALAEAMAAMPGLRLDGLMGMPPAFEDAECVRPFFEVLRRLYEMLPAENRRVLSMGMSGDYEVAIEEGSTMVRVGTAIFGPRKEIV